MDTFFQPAQQPPALEKTVTHATRTNESTAKNPAPKSIFSLNKDETLPVWAVPASYYK